MPATIRSTRATLLIWLLAMCVPLCCCRVGLVAALVSPGEAPDTSCCASILPPCCNSSHQQGPTDHHDDDADHHAQPGGDCNSTCCLKGMTLDTPADVELAHIFLDLVSLPVAPALVPDPANASVRSLHSTDLPPPARPTLLRLHCALII
jgi:hypothetical protein